MGYEEFIIFNSYIQLSVISQVCNARKKEVKCCGGQSDKTTPGLSTVDISGTWIPSELKGECGLRLTTEQIIGGDTGLKHVVLLHRSYSPKIYGQFFFQMQCFQESEYPLFCQLF